MRKYLTLLLAASLVLGCGQKKSEEAKQTASVKKDYIAEGFKYLEKTDIVRAIQSFDQAIQQDPGNINNYMVLGQVYLRLKNYERAVDTFSAAVKVEPNNGEVFYFLAYGLALKGEQEDKEKAIIAAKRSTEIFAKEKNEPLFARSLVLFKSLTEQEQKIEQVKDVASTKIQETVDAVASQIEEIK